MRFDDRIKRELTEGDFRALMEDAGYRVIDTGIEKVLRELCCLRKDEYEALQMPDNIRFLPDFTVLDRNQTQRFFVDVKYRSTWGRSLFDEASIREQAKLLGELVVVSFNRNPQDIKYIPEGRRYDSPSRYLRCCRLRYQRGNASTYEIEISERSVSSGSPETDQSRNSTPKGDEAVAFCWHDIKTVDDDHYLWWRMSPLQRVFSGLDKNLLETGRSQNSMSSGKSIQTAIRALRGILDPLPKATASTGRKHRAARRPG